MQGYMTVQELIEELEQMSPTAVVVLSADAEGNQYEPLRVASYPEAYYDGYESYTRLVGPLTDDLRRQGYTEADVSQPGDDAILAVVLTP